MFALPSESILGEAKYKHGSREQSKYVCFAERKYIFQQKNSVDITPQEG